MYETWKLGTVSPVSPSTVRKKNCFSLVGRQCVGISPALFVAEGRDSWPCPSSHSYVSIPRNHSLCHLIHLYWLLGVSLKDDFDHFLIGIWKVCIPPYGFVDDEMVGGFKMFWAW